MALFSRKKDEEKTEAAPVEKKVAPKSTASSTDRNLAGVILSPHITEKAVIRSESNVYTFKVHKDANKYDVAEAVKSIFKVTPVKVNIVNKAPRTYNSRTRGRVVSEKGMKKAYVYLKQGDSINLV